MDVGIKSDSTRLGIVVLNNSSHHYFPFRMKIDPEKGIHWPTMIADVVAGITLNVYSQLLLPNLPFLIKSYFPDVKYGEWSEC